MAADRGEGSGRRERAERPARGERRERGDRPDRAARPDRRQRSDRSERGDRGERPERTARPPGRERADRGERPERRDATERPGSPPARGERADLSRLGARRRPSERLDQPREARRRLRIPRPQFNTETFGRVSERFARFMGTATFLVYMSGFVVIWVTWNAVASSDLKFDAYPFIFLTLMLSLQASYAAPLILLAQNRQADRDRVALEQDRARDERNLADTEYLTREVAALRIALRDVATRDFIRSELRDLLEELEDRGIGGDADSSATPEAASPAKEPRRGS